MPTAIVQPRPQKPDYEAPAPTLKTERTSFSVKVCKAVRASDKRLTPFRERRKQHIKAFCGPYYGTMGQVKDQDKQPMNAIYTFVTSLIPSLGMWDIRLDGSSDVESIRRSAQLVAMATTLELKAMKAGQTYAEILVDAFFGPGISKIGIARGPVAGKPDFNDWRQDPERVFWKRISFDNYILDPRCTHRESAQLEGDKYRIVDEDARAHGYKSQILDKLDELLAARYHQKSSSGISHPGGTDDDTLYREYLFADVYLPREGVVVTIPIDEGAETFGFLEEVPWGEANDTDDGGPEGGPYDMLVLSKLPPDNPIPITLVEQQIDGHWAQNKLANKVVEQGEAAKDVFGYAPQMKDQAVQLANARTHSLIPMLDPKGGTERFNFPGPSAELLNALDKYREWNNRNGPNVSLIGGQEASSSTLGQDQLLAAASGQVTDDIKANALHFLERVGGRVAWYVWQRNRTVPVLKQVAGVEIPLAWSEKERGDRTLSDFLDIVFNVSVYTMGADNPQAQYARTIDLISKVVVPLMPQAMAQGVFVDMAQLVASQARKVNLRDTADWFKVGAPVGGGGGQETPGQQGTGNKTTISSGAISGKPANQTRPASTGEVNAQ